MPAAAMIFSSLLAGVILEKHRGLTGAWLGLARGNTARSRTTTELAPTWLHRVWLRLTDKSGHIA